MNGIKTMWIAVAAVAAVALLIVGYAWGASRGNNASIIGLGGGGYDSGYAAGLAAAKKKIQDSGIIPFAPETVMSVSGTVKSVDSDSFVINANPISPNPLDTRGPNQRTVMVSDKTKITVRISMSPDELSAAMKKFQDAIKANNGTATPPPSPFTEKTVAITDIKIGMAVTVTAAENIKDAVIIKATAVSFNAIPTEGAGAAGIPATGAPMMPPPVPKTK